MRNGTRWESLRREVARMVPPARARHLRCVERLAARLAGRHGVSVERARLAAILHDCARGAGNLQHGRVSAAVARRRFGVRDGEVLNAIARHTLGAERMSRLDRVLYVADSASSDRRYPGVGAIRREAGRDLNRAFRLAMSAKLRWVIAQEAPVAPAAIRAWNRLVSA